MFEATLKDTFKRIFDLDKVTYAAPSESEEQECLFIEVDSARPTIKDGRQVCRVNGRIRVYASLDKMPFGYFMKKLREASNNDTKDLFFFDFEQNVGQLQNIVERYASFIYFFNSQYDPAQGSITSIQTQQVSE